MSFTALIFVFTASIVVVEGDWKSSKFHDCCIKSGIPNACADEVCVYPPRTWPTINSRKCIQDHINPYIGCYADHKDNTQCCKEVGVKGIYEICQIFCNGVNPQYEKPDTRYDICNDAVKYISHCNWYYVTPPVRNLVSRRWLGPLHNQT